MADPITVMAVGTIVGGILGSRSKTAKPTVAEDAPPPVTKEDPNVKQAAMQYKKTLSQSSRSSARKNINYNDTLAKTSKLGY